MNSTCWAVLGVLFAAMIPVTINWIIPWLRGEKVEFTHKNDYASVPEPPIVEASAMTTVEPAPVKGERSAKVFAEMLWGIIWMLILPLVRLIKCFTSSGRKGTSQWLERHYLIATPFVVIGGVIGTVCMIIWKPLALVGRLFRFFRDRYQPDPPAGMQFK